MMKLAPASMVLVIAALTGPASAADPPGLTRAQGVVTSLSQTEISLREGGGKVDTIALIPTWSVSVSRPISVEAIAPGSYLGTTNHAKADGTGVSTEVHVSPPGVGGPGVDFLMDAAAQTTMTNGVVSTVVATEGGQVLAVDYGSGVRKITVPPGTPVVLNTVGDRGLIMVGRTVRVVTFTPATGGPPRQFVTVGPNGGPPPE